MRFRSTSAPSQFYILHAALRDVQCCLLISRRSSVALVVNLLVPRTRRQPAITLRVETANQFWASHARLMRAEACAKMFPSLL